MTASLQVVLMKSYIYVGVVWHVHNELGIFLLGLLDAASKFQPSNGSSSAGSRTYFNEQFSINPNELVFLNPEILATFKFCASNHFMEFNKLVK